MSVMNPVVLEQLDALIHAVDTGTDLIDHNLTIKDAWRQDPFKWARERLKVPMKAWARYDWARYQQHHWDGTKEPLFTASKKLAEGYNVAVSSATGIGKTYLGAILLFWFLDCWEGSQVVTMAPKEDQLTLHIWKEVGRMWHLFQKLHPKARLLNLSIQMRPHRRDWGAVGFVCGVDANEDVANRARGFHAEHMLFIIEETTGVNPAILRAVELTCTAPHNLRLFFGNPDSDQDSLALVSNEPNVVAIRASALDHPNIVCDDPTLIPGAQSVKVLDDWRQKYGDGLPSLEITDPIFQSRARGIPPGESRYALIRRDWCLAAVARAKDPEWAAKATQGKPASLGFDCAGSEDGDKATICFGRGELASEIHEFRCPDANEWARLQVWPYIDSGLVRQQLVGGDPIGVGHGAFMELKRLGAGEVQQLAGSAAAIETYDKDTKFPNLRSQMYWQARVDLQKGNIGMPDNPELIKDLTAATWTTRNSKIVVEAKEAFAKRLGRSPDKGDAFIYWNWARQAMYLSFAADSQVVAF